MSKLPLLLTVACATCLCPAGVAHAKSAGVTIQGLKFQPARVEIEVGDSVEWTNNDDRDHAVAAEDGSFKSGRLRSGKSYRRKFDKPGQFEYGDDLHPRMRGVVVVKPKRD